VDGVPEGGVPGDDPGLLLGMTAFETFRTYGGRPFRLGHHMDRFRTSVAAMDLPDPDWETLSREVRQVCEQLPHPDSAIRITLTMGGHRIVQALPIDPSRVGGTVHVAQVCSEPILGLPGFVKHGARAHWMLSAQELGVDEILLTDRDGFVLEANRSNVFAVRDSVLITPPLDGRLLDGVTRRAILEAAHFAGIPTAELPLTLSRIPDELYLSSTLKELAPVGTLDGVPISGDGPIGKAAHQALQRLIDGEC